MAGSVSGEIRAEPNLTPLLDVVFQLITFFMLVFRISGETYDQRVRLPIASSARPVERSSADQDRIILNIDSDGNLLWSGQVLDAEQAAREISIQAQLVRLNLGVAGEDAPAGGVLPTEIVIRADRRTPFGRLYSLIAACQSNGFTKFSLKAMNAGEE